MVNEDAALLNRRVTHMTPAALFSRRLHFGKELACLFTTFFQRGMIACL
jgi:hypothetical protein